MKISRRDILKFAVGSAAGVMLTPVPWKVLDDSAIWTQNWPWIPVPRKGEAKTRFTTCALCPAGCGLRARCIEGQPVSLAGVVDHPLSHGTICTMGLAAHHLAYHPSRVTAPVRRSQKFGTSESSPVTIDQAVEIITAAIRSTSGEETVAVLDQQPGRNISQIYRSFLAQIPHGIYLSAPVVEDATLAACASMLRTHEDSLGFDLENARTVVSFGAPLFDGWGTPGRMMRLVDCRRKNGKPTIHQIETRQSRTALQADTWIPIKPGTEGVFAMGLAHVLVEERLSNTNRLGTMASDFARTDSTSFTEVLAHFTPERVSAHTGVSVERIRSLARAMASEGPTIVLGAGDPAGGPLRKEENLAIASLNFLLGTVGRVGGIVARRPSPAKTKDVPTAPPTRQIQEIPDRSIRVLLLDGAESGHAIPWSLIERKLADEKALVVSFSPYAAGLSRHAELIVPSPAFLESLHDVPAPAHSPVETFSLSAPFLAPPQEATEPVEVMRKMATALGVAPDVQSASTSDQLKACVRALHSSGSGSVFTPAGKTTVRVKDLDSADKLWELLMEGGCWTDDPVAPTAVTRFSFFGKSGITAEQMIALGERQNAPASGGPLLTLMPFGWRGAAATAQVSPVLSKVYQESGLRSASYHALVNPETAKSRGIPEGNAATVQTQAGSIQVFARYDASVMPDVLLVAVGPDGTAINSGNTEDASKILSMCLADDGRSWRMAPVNVKMRTA